MLEALVFECAMEQCRDKVLRSQWPGVLTSSIADFKNYHLQFAIILSAIVEAEC